MAPTSQTAQDPNYLEGHVKYSLMNCRQHRRISSKNCTTEPQVKSVVCNSGRKTTTGAGDKVPRAGGRYCICRHSLRSTGVCPERKSYEQLSEEGRGSSSDGNSDLDSQITELQEGLESN